MSLEKERREYLYAGLDVDSLAKDPLIQFQRWLADMIEQQLSDPTAMCLSTCAADGKPSQRIVLLKSFDKSGFVFYTNLESRKSVEIRSNARVSLLFPWLKLDRQVIIEGEAIELSREEVINYFTERPDGSKLAAWSSRQSMPIKSRNQLDECYKKTSLRFDGKDIPVPGFWGGYRVSPDFFEFWQGRENRLHDRFSFSLDDSSSAWIVNRMSP